MSTVGEAGARRAVDAVGTTTVATATAWRDDVVRRVGDGSRFAGLYGRAVDDGCVLVALLAVPGGVETVETLVVPGPDGALRYPALTPALPAAFWYERAAHDLSGVVPEGHPRLDPLLLVVDADAPRPLPGGPALAAALEAVTPPGPVDVLGRGMFALPLGPVRSGVVESVELLLETPGEDIPHLNIRPHYKHRGVAKQLEGRGVDDAVLVAERVEGIASVAHALAFCHAVEAAAGTDVPERARLLRVAHAELERLAHHLDVATRLAEAAGLAVATSRFAWHKEEAMRLRSALCGHRFGRGVVVPGGVAAPPSAVPSDVAARLRAWHTRASADLALAMRTPSFVDRLRGTGVLTAEIAARWAALGPLGRASGLTDDARWDRPTDAYAELPLPGGPAVRDGGDVMARAAVRWDEVDDAADLAVRALDRLAELGPGTVRVAVDTPSGQVTAHGWAEAAHGEVLHALTLRDGVVQRCFARSPSLHNLAVLHDVFGGDVFTDLAFIEASFGLGYAGAAM